MGRLFAPNASFVTSNHSASGGLTYSYIASDIHPTPPTAPPRVEGTVMKISARNALPGKIVDIKKGATTAHVRIDVNGTVVTASI